MAAGPVVDDGLAGDGQLVVGLNIVEIAEATHDMPECLRVRRLEAGQEELESLLHRASGALFDGARQ
jgi:hypothetical protein